MESKTRLQTLLVCVCLTVVCTNAGIPSDWAARQSAGQLLYAETLPSNAALNPSVGNGYVATVIGSDTYYVSGLFNGLDYRTPSHRARIPSFVNVDIAGDGLVLIGRALDMEKAIVYQRSQIGQLFVEQRWYAHQVDRYLLVHEIYVKNAGKNFTSFTISVNSGSASSDIAFSTSENQDYTLLYGKINTPEVSNGQVVSAAVAYSNIPKKITVAAGSEHTYSYIVATRTSLDSQDPNTDVVSTYKSAVQNVSGLMDSHIRGWQNVWKSGFEFGGNLPLAQTVNSSLYYLLSSVRSDWEYNISPGSLSSNAYNGHTFWDSETWMWPNFLVLHPDSAKSMLAYRHARLPASIAKAKSYNKGWQGAMFAWESAFTGVDTSPSSDTKDYEHHISGDIALACRQYFYLTNDVDWLKTAGWGLIKNIADFWASRSTLKNGQYAIDGVIGPDEYAVNVNNSVYTNYVAKISLDFADEVSKLIGQPANPNWAIVSRNMIIPYSASEDVHPEFDGYHGQTVKQADVVLLPYPLGMKMARSTQLRDLEYYIPRTDANGPAMTYAMFAIGFLDLGMAANASAFFKRSYANSHEPFGVWMETPTGGAINFITGAGGFLQTIWAGYGSVRIWNTSITMDPTLPENTTSIKLRQVSFRNSTFDVSWDLREISITLQETSASAPKLYVDTTSTKNTVITKQGLRVAVGPITIHV